MATDGPPRAAGDTQRPAHDDQTLKIALIGAAGVVIAAVVGVLPTLLNRQPAPPITTPEALVAPQDEATPTDAPPNPTATPDTCDCSHDSYRCADFSTQREAQACYDFCLEQTGTDVHRLDSDEDGVVCEDLPD